MKTINIKYSSEKEQEILAKHVLNIISGNHKIYSEIGYTLSKIDVIYNIASAYLKAKRYEDACKIFTFLHTMNSNDLRFNLGLAACFQGLGKYEVAFNYYQMANGIDVKQPMSMLRSAECLIALDDLDGAREALWQSLERSTNSPAYDLYAQQADIMLNKLMQ